MGVMESIQERIDSSNRNANIYKRFGAVGGGLSIGLALWPEINGNAAGRGVIAALALTGIKSCLDALQDSQRAAALEGTLAQHQLQQEIVIDPGVSS